MHFECLAVHCNEWMGGWGWGSVLRKSCASQNNKKSGSKSGFFKSDTKYLKISVLGKPSHIASHIAFNTTSPYQISLMQNFLIYSDEEEIQTSEYTALIWPTIKFWSLRAQICNIVTRILWQKTIWIDLGLRKVHLGVILCILSNIYHEFKILLKKCYSEDKTLFLSKYCL